MNVVVHAYEDERGPDRGRRAYATTTRSSSSSATTARESGPRADIERESLRMGLPLIAALSTQLRDQRRPRAGAPW